MLVDCAADGEMALHLARRQRLDAILLDVMLPTLNGWEVMLHLQADNDIRNVFAISSLLGMQQIRILEAENGREALEQKSSWC